MQKKLPIGLASLEEIIINDYLYIDKTQHVANLVDSGKYYFLSRPRRFGKTLLLDTIEQAFLGNKNLFFGLYLENNWDWSKTNPVIHISFSGGDFSVDGALDVKITELLGTCVNLYDIELKNVSHSGKLEELITKLREKTGNKVVVLIDEYDKPILDAIANTELAIKNREILKGFYGTMKDHDVNLRFVFITGVTKFAKAGIFSQLNNLNDISLNSKYADICGYTHNDIETSFCSYLANVDFSELKRWYNGYNFLGTESQKVYNPFDILLFISNGNIYRNYWFSTGTPTFLIKLLQKNNYYLPELEGMELTDSALADFDIENLSAATLLLQSGYLTITSAGQDPTMGIMLYKLDYPNFEVRQSLNDTILANLLNKDGYSSSYTTRMRTALVNNNFDQVKNILNAFLASIPHDWHRNNQIGNYEGYYCSVVYTFFNAMGLVATPEDRTNLGQIDLTIQLKDKILIIEFKMLSNDNAKNALQQIKDRNYHEKYIDQNKDIYLIGMVFDGEIRNLCEYEWEKLHKI